MIRIHSYFIFMMLLVFTPSDGIAAGRMLVAVQSVETQPYDAAFNGIKSVLGPDATIQRVVLSKMSRGETGAFIRDLSPDLLISIGMNAHLHLTNFKDIPLVYVLAPNPEEAFSGKRNLTGIRMNIPPERVLAILLEVLPKAETLGALYDPQRTGQIVAEIEAAAVQKGVFLATRQVILPRSVPIAFMEMRRNIDVFWMLADLTVITPENLEFLFVLAMESSTPILTFSEKYLELGALLSVGVDPFDMGCQAGEIIRQILSGADAGSIPSQNPRETVISINGKVAEKLGIQIDEALRERARIIE